MFESLSSFPKTTQLIKIKPGFQAGLSAQRPQSDHLLTSVEGDIESPAGCKDAQVSPGRRLWGHLSQALEVVG